MQSFQSRFRQTKPVFMANIAGVTGNLHPVQQRRILMSIVLPFLVMITITTAGYAALSTPRNTYIMALLLLMTVLNAVSFVVCRTRFYRWGLAIFLAMLSMGYLGLSLLLQRVSIVYSLSLMMNAVVFIASLFYRPRTAVIFATAAVIVTVISIGASSDYTGLIDTMLIVGSTSLFYVLVIFASYVQYENTLLVDQQTDALIESEQRFRSIFEQTFQLAAFMQSDGRVIDANDNMLALVTDVDERVVGRMIWELNLWTYMDHTPEQVKAYVQQAATGHTTTTEITYTRRPGHERIFEIWLQPVHERSDDTVMISMTGRELTELKTSERRLQSEARRYRALFEEIKDGLMLVGLDNRLIIMNPAGARMLGYEATEIEGMPLEKLVGTADDMVNMENTINSLLDDQPVVPGERMLRGKDGALLPIEINPSLVYDAHQQPLYIQTVFRDLTERRRAERQSIELEMERERIHLLQEFVSGITHDLRTPLSNVKNSEYLLRRVGMTSPDKFEHYLNVIREEIDKLNDIVDNQVAAVRETIPSRPIDEHLPVNVNEIVRMVIATARNRVKDRTVTLNLMDEDAIPAIPGNVDRLRMAVRQIVLNAIHFTDDDGYITVTTRAGEHYVQVMIKDDGIGISEDDQPFIFDSLYRADRARSESSSGLGLTIAYQIVMAHNGTIIVESEPGEGSQFTLHLPIRATSEPTDETRPAR